MSTRMHRARASKGYESISRDLLQERSLSLKARGLIGLLLSLPDDWECNGARGIAKQFCDRDGEHSINEGLKELEAKGLLVRLKRQGSDGRWEWLWTYSEDPEEVAEEVQRWLQEGYRVSAKRGGPKTNKPPQARDQRSDEDDDSTVLEKSQHGTVLGKSGYGSSGYGNPLNKESSLVLDVLEKRPQIDTQRAATPPCGPSALEVDTLPVQASASDEEEIDEVGAEIAQVRRRWNARTPAVLNATAHSVQARQLVNAFNETCTVRLPRRTFAQWCVSVDELLRQDVPVEVIKQAMVECRDKGYGPRSLHSFASALANRASSQTQQATQQTRKVVRKDEQLLQYIEDCAQKNGTTADQVFADLFPYAAEYMTSQAGTEHIETPPHSMLP